MPWEPPSSLRQKLRDLKPDYLLVHTEEHEEPQRVTCPNHRNRAQRVLRTLGELNWNAIEFFDRKNGLLGKHVRSSADEPTPGELESLPTARHTADATAFLNLMIRAQDMALTRVAGMMQPLLDAVYKLLDKADSRLTLIERQYEHALKVNTSMADDLIRATLALQQGPASDEDGNTAGPVMTSLLPAFMRAAFAEGDGKPAAPTKGKPAKGKKASPSESSQRPRSPPNGANGPRTD